MDILLRKFIDSFNSNELKLKEFSQSIEEVNIESINREDIRIDFTIEGLELKKKNIEILNTMIETVKFSKDLNNEVNNRNIVFKKLADYQKSIDKLNIPSNFKGSVDQDYKQIIEIHTRNFDKTIKANIFFNKTLNQYYFYPELEQIDIPIEFLMKAKILRKNELEKLVSQFSNKKSLYEEKFIFSEICKNENSLEFADHEIFVDDLLDEEDITTWFGKLLKSLSHTYLIFINHINDFIQLGSKEEIDVMTMIEKLIQEFLQFIKSIDENNGKGEVFINFINNESNIDDTIKEKAIEILLSFTIKAEIKYLSENISSLNSELSKDIENGITNHTLSDKLYGKIDTSLSRNIEFLNTKIEDHVNETHLHEYLELYYSYIKIPLSYIYKLEKLFSKKNSNYYNTLIVILEKIKEAFLSFTEFEKNPKIKSEKEDIKLILEEILKLQQVCWYNLLK